MLASKLYDVSEGLKQTRSLMTEFDNVIFPREDGSILIIRGRDLDKGLREKNGVDVVTQELKTIGIK